MDDLRISAMACAALAGGPWLFARGFRDFRIKRLMQNTPTARIRSMAMGLVEVNGRVSGRSRTAAPFSGRDCVYWQVDVATRGRRRDGWHVVHRDASGNPFFLEDDTGVAMVYPHGADCRLPNGVEEECSGLSLPEPYASYLQERCGPGAGLWRLGSMRFRERILEEGQHVYLLGSAMPKPNVLTVSEGWEDEALEATGTETWSARRIAERQRQVSAVIRRGEHERVFIISPQSERDMTLLLGLKSVAELVGGPLMTLAGLAYWLDVWRRMHAS